MKSIKISCFYRFVFFCFILMMTSCTDINSLGGSFNKMMKYASEENYEEAVNYLPPQIINEIGKENWITGMKNIGNEFFDVNISKATIEEKGNIIISGDTSYCVFVSKQKEKYNIVKNDLPIQNKEALFNNKKDNPSVQNIKWIEKYKSFELESLQLYLAVSYNSGDKWYFLTSPNDYAINLLVPNKKNSELIFEEAKKIMDPYKKGVI